MSLWISPDGKRATHKCFDCGANAEYNDVLPEFKAERAMLQAEIGKLWYAQCCADQDRDRYKAALKDACSCRPGGGYCKPCTFLYEESK